MADERSFIMVKPDGVQRGLVGEIVKRFEQKGFKLVAMKFMKVRTRRGSVDVHMDHLLRPSHFSPLCIFTSPPPVLRVFPPSPSPFRLFLHVTCRNDVIIVPVTLALTLTLTCASTGCNPSPSPSTNLCC